MVLPHLNVSGFVDSPWEVLLEECMVMWVEVEGGVRRV